MLVYKMTLYIRPGSTPVKHVRSLIYRWVGDFPGMYVLWVLCVLRVPRAVCSACMLSVPVLFVVVAVLIAMQRNALCARKTVTIVCVCALRSQFTVFCEKRFK